MLLKNDTTWYFPNLQYSDCREIIFQPTVFIIMNHCRSSDGGWWWGGGEVQRHSADDGTPDQPPVQGLYGLQWPRYVFFTNDIEQVFLMLVICSQDLKIAITSDMCRCGVVVEALEVQSDQLLIFIWACVYFINYKCLQSVKLMGSLTSQSPLIVWFKYYFTLKWYIVVFIKRSLDIQVYSIYGTCTAIVDFYASSLLGVYL